MKDIGKSYRENSIPDDAEKVFKGVIFDVYQWEQELFDGSTAVFERLSRSDSAVVFPILEDGSILLIEDEQPARDVKLTVPAGSVDGNEEPQQVAARELLEETGYEAEELIPFIDFAPWNKIDWRIYYFIGKNCKKVAEPLVQAGERITPKISSFDEMIEYAVKGELDQPAFSILALQAKLDPRKMEKLRNDFFQS